jgi:signal peptidase II
MKLWVSLVIALVVVVLDFVTKRWIEAALDYGEHVPLTGFFNLVLAYNAGAAFSFLSDAGGWQRWFFTIVSTGASILIVFLLRRHAADRLFCIALSLILGGALGNLWDRATLGHVVDFLDFHVAGYHWPAFNVADSAISVGAVLLVIDGFLRNDADTAKSK